MMGLLDHKTVILVGADAIGAGAAMSLAREGADVAILDEDIAGAQAISNVLASEHRRSFAAPVAFSGEESAISISTAVKRVADRFGGVHVLINNVLPLPAVAPFEEQTSDLFAAAFARVQAAVFAMQAVMPFMRSAGGGRIINIGHRYGESVNEGIAAYNAAAWSLVGITRTAALDWGQYQIATNLLLPLADTPEFRSYHQRRAKLLDLMISQLPLGRAGDCVKDIGGAVLFLASDAANFVNGEVVHADGGQHLAGPVVNPARFR